MAQTDRIQFSLRSLVLFVLAITGGLTLIVGVGGACQPFGVVAIGYTLVFVLLGSSSR